MTVNAWKEGGKREEGREWWNNAKGSRTMQGAGSNPNTGITAHTTPAIQQDHPANKRGGRQHADGKSVTPPPFHHYAAHHRNTRPTIHNGPHHHHDEGEDEQRIPHHTMSEERYSPPHSAGPNKEQYTARLCSTHSMHWGVDGTGHTHWTGVDR